MSVVFLVVPAVAVSWPVMCAAVTAAAGALGFAAASAASNELSADEAASSLNSNAEVVMEGSQIIADAMAADGSFVITRGDVAAAFKRTPDGKCSVHVSSKTHTKTQLDEIGRELVGRITQQYAYHKVISEMKSQGFTVANEEVNEEGIIRIHVSKYV